MSIPYYPGSLYTPVLGLALFGMDEVLAENMVILDTAYGAGSSIFVNGTLVESPNLSSTTPAAPGGQELVTFQYDSNGNISAYVPIPAAGGVTSFTGDSVVYNNAASTGAVSLSLIAQTKNTVLAGPTTGANATPTFRALVSADIPNNAANTSGTAANLSGTPALPNGTTATTQVATDATTLIATDAFVQNAIDAAAPLLGIPWFNLIDALDYNQVVPWYNNGSPFAIDTGISRISAGVLGIGTGAQGSVAGGLELKTLQILDSAANVDFLLKNTTAATSSTPQSSPIFEIEGAWWGGGLASATDGWSIQNVPSSSTTLASGLITHVVETAGSGVTLTLTSGGTTFATYSWVIFQGFTTATWLNGVPVQLVTTSTTSMIFTDPTNHGTLASTADTASAAQATSYLTFSQISGSASLGVIQLLNPTAGNVATTNQSPTLQFAAYYDSAGASALDTWNLYSDLQEGSNAQSNLDIVRIGGTGIAQINFCGATPNFVFQNNNSTSAPTAQFRFTGGSATTLPGQGTVYWGFGSHQYAASGTFEFFGGSGTVSNAVQVFTATGQCGIGIGNLTPSATLEVYNAKASTGATQLLVQGGAVAADATTNTLFQINQGGGTTALFSITGAGHVNNGAADFQGSVTSAPTGITATNVVVAVGAATGTFTVTSTEGFTVGDTITLSAGGWTAGSGLASTTATVASVTSPTAMVLTYVSGGPWVAGTYAAQTGTLTQTGGTSVSVIYKTAYTNTPTVIVTPTANCGAWYVSASSTTGFTITYATSGTKTFNYLVLGNPN